MGQRFLADVEGMVHEAEAIGFDVDEVAGETLDVPALTLSDLDVALNRPDVRPPGAEWERLDSGSYALRLPGMGAKIRVTTSAEVFDDHFESHDFLSPGGAVFAGLSEVSGAEIAVPPDVKGYSWLVKSCPNRRSCNVIVSTQRGPSRVSSLGELIETLNRSLASAALDQPDDPSSNVRCLA